MIGGAAGEVMAAVHTAMLASLSYSRLANAAFAHPTMAEGLGLLFSNVPPRAGWKGYVEGGLVDVIWAVLCEEEQIYASV
jgi:hypothetical protein